MATNPDKLHSFRRIFESSLSAIHNATGPAPQSKRCLILSGGVDTAAILSASTSIGITYGAAFTVVTGETSPDLGFSQACAKEYGIQHHVVYLSPVELVEQFLPDVIRRLKKYDGMTIRNSLVIAAVFKKASEMGYQHAIVGDGADELFGGYSFMWGCEDDPVEWRKKRDDMCKNWTFATQDLAEMYGMKQYSPYIHPEMVQWALENTGREDCIGTRPIRLLYGQERQEHITGKVILREAYETVSSWRRKDPIEVGSGATVIGHDEYWKDYISDEEFEAETAQLSKRGYRMRSKEQLVNFREFEKIFGLNGVNGDRIRLSIGEGCVDCCFDIGDTMFCNMCGAYPAQRSKAATHYYDFKLKKLVAKDEVDVNGLE